MYAKSMVVAKALHKFFSKDLLHQCVRLYQGPVKAPDATKSIWIRLCYLRRRGRLIFVRRALAEL